MRARTTPASPDTKLLFYELVQQMKSGDQKSNLLGSSHIPPNNLPSFERSYKREILHWLEKEPDLIIMLWGPRQSGKTTLILQVLAAYSGASQYINADEFNEEIEMLAFPTLKEIEPEKRLAAWMLYSWEQARQRAGETGKPFVLVIDEVQKIDDWSRRIKGMWDRDRREFHPIHVVLLGSSPHQLQKGLSESLCGRYQKLFTHHWSYSEMSQAFGFSLDEFIYYGGYPGAAKYLRRGGHSQWYQHVKESVVTNNINRDILDLIEIKKPEVMKQLYAMGARYSGQLFSFQKISESLQGGDQPLLRGYLRILGQVFMLAGLSPYAKDLHKQGGTPKFQVFNTALMSVAHNYDLKQARQKTDYWGRLVESAVGAHLLSTLPYRANLHYWRYENHEVDFVVEMGLELIAIEVKSGRKKKTATAGIEEFKKRFDVTKTMIIGTGGDMTLQQFLSEPATTWCTP